MDSIFLKNIPDFGRNVLEITFIKIKNLFITKILLKINHFGQMLLRRVLKNTPKIQDLW